jgi:tetratricopeptide (TPR) repeat protein
MCPHRLTNAFLVGLALLLPVAGAFAAEPGTDLAKQLAAVRRRAAAVSPGTPAARDLARDLAQIGVGYLEAGDTGRSIELLEEAYGWNERDGLILAQLTLAYVRAENYPFARFYLELAERQAPGAPPEIYGTLGDVYYGLNRVEDAVLAWEQFERLRGNDPSVLRRLSAARQELSIARGQKVLELDDFAIYSDASISPDMIDHVSQHLTEDYAAMSSFLQARLPYSQVVILYAGRAYFSLVSIPDWVGGLFDGKIRISLDPDGGMTPRLEAVLRHELSHALIRYASGDRAPGWVHEGLAQWYEGKRLTIHDQREIFKNHQPVSIAEMDRSVGRKTDRATAQINYGEALGLIEYLMQHRGEGALVCLLRDLAEGMSIEEALDRETGLTPSGLVSAWKAWVGI